MSRPPLIASMVARAFRWVRGALESAADQAPAARPHAPTGERRAQKVADYVQAGARVRYTEDPSYDYRKAKAGYERSQRQSPTGRPLTRPKHRRPQPAAVVDIRRRRDG